jgi:hypothetical protein
MERDAFFKEGKFKSPFHKERLRGILGRGHFDFDGVLGCFDNNEVGYWGIKAVCKL